MHWTVDLLASALLILRHWAVLNRCDTLEFFPVNRTALSSSGRLSRLMKLGTTFLMKKI